MKLHVPLLAAALLCSAAAFAQTNTFDLVVSNVRVGKSVYTLNKGKDGYKLASRQTFRMSGRDGDQSDEFRLGESYSFLEGTGADHNSQLQLGYSLNKAHNQVTISRYQSGSHDNDVASIGPDLVVMPPLDAGAAQVALLYVLAHPRADNTYSLLVPGGASRGGGGGGRRGGGAPAQDAGAADEGALPAGNNAIDVVLLKGKDTSGFLDGKPLLLHSYLLGMGKLRLSFYADEQNNLMQFNAPAFQASYVRANFKLNMGVAALPATPATHP